MSSFPGYDLEDFVCCKLKIKVQGRYTKTISCYAEKTISEETFQTVLDLFLPYKDEIEDALYNFDYSACPWDTYSMYCFDFIPDEVFLAAKRLVKSN